MRENSVEIRSQVPRNDPEYQEILEKDRKFPTQRIFGSNSVYLYESDLRDIELAEASLEELNENEEKLLADGVPKEVIEIKRIFLTGRRDSKLAEKGTNLKNNFRVLLVDYLGLIKEEDMSERIAFVKNELAEMVFTPEAVPELCELFGDDMSTFSVSNLLAAINAGKTSDELLFCLANTHLKRMEKKERQLEEIATETKEAFEQIFRQWVDAGDIPESALENLLPLKDIRAHISDRLLNMQSGTMGESMHNGDILASDDQLTPEKIPRLKKTIMHELIHSVAGKSIAISTETFGDNTKFKHAFLRKSGVLLGNPDGYSPNHWLNEAITEWLALRFSGYSGDSGENAFQGSRSYPDERRDLERLMEAGLSTQTITEAYFENFASNQNKGKGQGFAGLVAEINRIEGPGGFNRLENIHILREITHELSFCSVPILPVEDADPEFREQLNLSPKNERRVVVSVGNTPETSIERELFFIENGVVNSNGRTNTEAVTAMLQSINNHYNGRVKAFIVTPPPPFAPEEHHV